MSKASGGLALLAAFLFSVLPISAVTPQFWEFAAQSELLKGKMKGVSLTSDGRLTLAPSYELLFDTEQAYLFSMATDSSGRTYIGSGHDGKIFRIDPNGKGTLFYKAAELDVYALAIDSRDNLYAGTSPDGKVYRISPDGKAGEFFDPEDKYIWALAFDRQDNLYVATGGRGVIYKVDKTGKATELLDSDETHIVSLVLDRDGSLIAGSSPNGYIYRISQGPGSSGRAFVLYDSPLSEVRALALDGQGNIYAAALAGAPAQAPPPAPSPAAPPTIKIGPPAGAGAEGQSARSEPQVEVQGEERVEVKVTPPVAVASPGKDTGGLKSAIYKISREGWLDTLWSSNEDLVYSLLLRPSGSGMQILASTGTRGRILAINPSDKSFAILVESTEEQVVAMVPRPAPFQDILAATSNLGKVFAMKSEQARSGWYESEVRDSRAISSWGKISWRVENGPGQTIELYVRTGNTEKPDNTWSEWTGPYRNREGEQITSPPARYLQWKAVFKASERPASGSAQPNGGEALTGINIAFLQQNLPPRIVAINILPPGIALQRIPLVAPTAPSVSISATSTLSGAGTTQTGPSQMPRRFKPAPQQRAQQGAQSFAWKAEDDNDDDLIYSIYFKAEGETDWKPLQTKLEEDYYTVDSNALPDGIYQIKVVASDSPSNPYGRGLTSELVSKPFVIDNTPPTVSPVTHRVEGKKVTVRFRAEDLASKIKQAEFSLDGGEWHLLFPADGIADSKIEEYELTLDDLGDGEHTIALRATDIVNNVGTSKLVVTIKSRS